MPKIAFNIPETSKVHVHYKKDGVSYRATMPTPKDNESLRIAMLGRKVGMSQVTRLEGFDPIRGY